MQYKVKSLFISDLHLNTKFCKAEALVQLLKTYECENLFLVGDILDFYVKGIHLPKQQMNVIRKILTKAKRGTNVVYILGNHDESLVELLDYDVNIDNLKIVNEYIYETNKHKILLTHGHIVDSPIVSNLYVLGDYCYTAVLYLNDGYNFIRKMFGFKYHSLSQKLKSSVKDAVKFIEDYEKCIVNHAKTLNCNVVLSGHIHQATMKKIDKMCYMNTGDFVESCTAIIEDYDGDFKLLKYNNNGVFEVT